MKNRTLILSIALNGYQWIYKPELKSHAEYAKNYGYQYQAITAPFISKLGVECCWLKLTLLKAALISGYEQVLFLDADTMVSKHCPAIEMVLRKRKFVYMAKGHSGRYNSGVLLVKRHKESIEWLDKVIGSIGQRVEKDSIVGWGENGHVIEAAKGVNFIAELDKKWNNTSDEKLNDFIRHRNCGPLRTNTTTKLFHKIIFFLSARYLKFKNKKDKNSYTYSPFDLLMKETAIIRSLYPNI